LREGWEVQLARAAVAKSMMWQPGGREGGREGRYICVRLENGGKYIIQAYWYNWREGGRSDHLPALAIAIAEAIEAPLVS
jgi:hypothetical protein